MGKVKTETQRHMVWAERLNGELDLWCWMWPVEKLQHVKAEFSAWMRACDQCDSRLLTSYADYVATALGNAKKPNWWKRPLDAAYVMCREQFFGYAADAYERRFPIHGPWPQEHDDVPF